MRIKELEGAPEGLRNLLADLCLRRAIGDKEESNVMKIVVLVCRRSDQGPRDELWRYVKLWWRTELPELAIFEGHHNAEEGLFSRSICFNRAAKAAGAWDCALICDSDVFLQQAEQAYRAAMTAISTGQMAFAHNWRFAFNQEATASILKGFPIPAGYIPPPEALESEYGSFGPTWSSCQAIHRQLWDVIGGFDERFVGWGCEDWAFWTACNAMAGGHKRIEGAVHHLWHPRSPAWEGQNPHYPENDRLGRRYLNAKDDKAKMETIINEWKELRASR
jgi:hypothetical protein